MTYTEEEHQWNAEADQPRMTKKVFQTQETA